MSKYHRDEYEEVEMGAMIALAGLLAGGRGYEGIDPAQIANEAFDIAEHMLSVKKARLGAKPIHD